MPSYLPQAKTKCLALESSWAVACLNSSPAGEGKITIVSAVITESKACPQGSAFISIPAPPPKGVSSTVRCLSSVKSRRSWIFTSSRSWALALPRRDMSSTSKNCGKMLMASILIFDTSFQVYFKQPFGRGQCYLA